MKRCSGIIMSVSSLPSPYGIGTFGRAAYDFTDFLASAGQSVWQILPLGPTGYGDSPYQSFSTYAGNPYFIDLDMLAEEGLLTQEEIAACDWGSNPRYVDYGKLYESRFLLLEKAKERVWEAARPEVEAFVREHNRWLPDYTLFMACKKHFGMRPWYEWPEDIRLRKSPGILAEYRERLKDDIELYTYIQYLFFRQWEKLKAYIHEKDIRIIGDVPIYVAMDSADVWSEPWFFQLDEKNVPLAVAGVPPDYFCEDGQLWGNPLYRWDKMKEDGYGWWIRRIDGAGKLYDIIRIDHFRAFDTYWSVPRDSETARTGHWCPGPGMELINIFNNWFPQLEFIAEDLGAPMKSVKKLLKDSGWPGMKVLEFAFDPREPSDYLPHKHTENCICYTATHDNEPIMLWKEGLPEEALAYVKEYLHITDDEPFNWAIIRTGMMSVSKLFMVLMQDYLGLGRYHTMNNPGISEGNWQWRLLAGEASPELAEKIRHLTFLYERMERPKAEEAEEAEAEVSGM
ncbi:MAG: 4-alpha-glucanotransferase [Lachnospiraceae bacterium]|nr:4-alpha-glucanotransferase [Lachnospiraceae bacterium]